MSETPTVVPQKTSTKLIVALRNPECCFEVAQAYPTRPPNIRLNKTINVWDIILSQQRTTSSSFNE